jgi:hypothetical protein
MLKFPQMLVLKKNTSYLVHKTSTKVEQVPISCVAGPVDPYYPTTATNYTGLDLQFCSIISVLHWHIIASAHACSREIDHCMIFKINDVSCGRGF